VTTNPIACKFAFATASKLASDAAATAAASSWSFFGSVFVSFFLGASSAFLHFRTSVLSCGRF
jgi:hypothetical protein